jgi:hypothetical protein
MEEYILNHIKLPERELIDAALDVRLRTVIKKRTGGIYITVKVLNLKPLWNKHKVFDRNANPMHAAIISMHVAIRIINNCT